MWAAEAPPPDRPRRGRRFKGSGFYQTDYRSESYKKSAAADNSAATAAGGGAKSDGKSEAKGKEKKAKKDL